MIVAGTRPELIKLAPLFWEFESRGLDYVFIWSGQHYDFELSEIFIQELKIPDPDIDLGVKSGSHAEQTAKTIIGVENAIYVYKPRLTIALGDTNTTLAAAIASVKVSLPFSHVEAGLRSWNMKMPEEVNRILVDHISQILFVPSMIAYLNLLGEGITSDRVFLSGNTIIDVLTKVVSLLEKEPELVSNKVVDLCNGSYILVTVHRQENTESYSRLSNIVYSIELLSRQFKIIIPLHPRTRKKLAEFGLLEILRNNPNIKLLKPLGYTGFLYCLKHAQLTLTDSGGVQEEAFTLGVPTVTLRYNTERPETVLAGCNVLAGDDVKKIVEYSEKMITFRGKICSRLNTRENPYGDGKASKRIVDVIQSSLDDSVVYDIVEPDLRDTPYIIYKIKEINKLDRNYDEVLSYIENSGVLSRDKAKAIAALVRSKVKVLKPWESFEF